MNKLDKDYQNLLKDILENGVKKKTRNGGTLSVFGRTIRHDMKTGFPSLTTKKLYFKGVVTELLWFLKGRTDLRYLVDNDCHIWDGDCYQSYLKEYKKLYYHTAQMTKEEFINRIKTDDEFAKKWGLLGKIYGHGWRKWNGEIDQISDLIKQLKENPDSRRLLLSAWNPSDLDSCVLPPCHYGFQVYTRELSWEERWKMADLKPNMEEFDWANKYCDHLGVPKRAISLMFNMRSTDVPLGLPFNIASYGLLLEIIGKIVNMVPEELIATLGDAHIYTNQVDGIKEQLTRRSFKLPHLKHLKSDEFYKSLGEDLSLLSHLEISDFQIENYESHPAIKMPLSN